jgi:hypothetical protein
VAHAFTDGIRRVLSAPALLVCVAAISLSSPLYPNIASRRILFEFVLVGSFMAGGIIDRYARMRPTRAFGFFGACGRHLGAMLRLAAIEILFYLAVDNLLTWTAAAIGGVSVISMYMVYARVRLVVEDRRSAFGAFGAAVRFVNRNPAAVAIFVLWSIPAVVALRYARGAAPILLLPLYASATALFQSRLSHAGYTAAPRLEWPESPAAETIANPR